MSHPLVFGKLTESQAKIFSNRLSISKNCEKAMTNTLMLVKALDTSTPHSRGEKPKPRRQRRQEQRDRVKAAKLKQKKIDQLSV